MNKFAVYALLAGTLTGPAIVHGEPIPLVTDAPGAWSAVVSLPLPREQAEALYGDGAAPAYTLAGVPAAQRPLGWWTRDEVPRRVMLYAASDGPIGAAPAAGVTSESVSAAAGANPWSADVRPFKTHDWMGYKVILRGGTNAESHSRWDDLLLRYKDTEVALRFGTRRDKFHHSSAFAGTHDWWQWVSVEPLLETSQVTLLRVGGLLYNEDTFHHCDVYLELFVNGVARVKAHFVNARVIGDGWEYFGIPVIGFTTPGDPIEETTLDGAQTRFELGGLKLDIAESAELVSEEHPGSLYPHEGLSIYQPWQDQRVTDQAQTYGEPFITNIGDARIPRGMARTVRFTFSLSSAPPEVAHLLAPAWLYAQAEELWHGDYLPAQWRYAPSVHGIAEGIAHPDPRYHGSYEAGFSGRASEGNGGSALIFSAMLHGDLYHLERGLSYAYNWADIMVDHVDWSVRQPFTGYYWKTHPYVKFADLVAAFLETGDPYLLETAEHVANGYHALMRSTWPVRSIGRGAWPAEGLIELFGYTRNPYHLERALDVVRMTQHTYRDPADLPGHQIGVGPNGIGNHGDMGVQGFAELVLAHAAIETALQDSVLILPEKRQEILEFAEYVIGLVTESLRIREAQSLDTGWREYETGMLIITLLPLAVALNEPHHAEELEQWTTAIEDYLRAPQSGRPHHAITGRAYYDAVTIGARWVDGALHIAPEWFPSHLDGAHTAVVQTPRGPIEVRLEVSDGEVRVLSQAPAGSE